MRAAGRGPWSEGRAGCSRARHTRIHVCPLGQRDTREGSKTTLRDVPARLGPEAAQVGQSLSSSL